jgi:hypothetical protein
MCIVCLGHYCLWPVAAAFTTFKTVASSVDDTPPPRLILATSSGLLLEATCLIPAIMS